MATSKVGGGPQGAGHFLSRGEWTAAIRQVLVGMQITGVSPYHLDGTDMIRVHLTRETLDCERVPLGPGTAYLDFDAHELLDHLYGQK